MGSNVDRLVAVVLTVSDLDRAMRLYSEGFGLDFHVDDHHGEDPWINGRHAATSWSARNRDDDGNVIELTQNT